MSNERLDALTVRETNGKSFWTKIGVAWPNKNGPGYVVRLDAMPASVDGQFAIHLREPLPRDGQRQSAGSPPNDGRGGYAGGAGDDLGDSVPY